MCASAAIDVLATTSNRGAAEDTRFVIHGAAFTDEEAGRLTAFGLRRLAATLEVGDAAMLRLLAESAGAQLPAFIPRAVARGHDVTLSSYEMMGIGLLHYTKPAWEVRRIFDRAMAA